MPGLTDKFRLDTGITSIPNKPTDQIKQKIDLYQEMSSGKKIQRPGLTEEDVNFLNNFIKIINKKRTRAPKDLERINIILREIENHIRIHNKMPEGVDPIILREVLGIIPNGYIEEYLNLQQVTPQHKRL
ncbi:MAG: hypothetical protein NZ908_01425 [Candidatus Micrarchaeota archaeon]|nr:hypothetical protein [Candidatus Micrarchaeota archaeon]MCX8154713.1 hypothetical protein [Candidatus Micrarchaeota archaeon]